MSQLRELIEEAWDSREKLQAEKYQSAVRDVIDQLDKGKLRIAERKGNDWQVNEWVKKAVILYFPIQKMEVTEAGPLEFHDKMKLKRDYRSLNVRVVPHAVARYGSYLAPGVS